MSQKAEDEASRLADERVSLLIELGASKDELFTFRAEASKEKKAMEEAFDEGFDVIFNYGYGCCAFSHNICGSVPVIPNTSKPLLPEKGKSLPTAEVGLGIQSNSLNRVIGENEEPDASRGTGDCILLPSV